MKTIFSMNPTDVMRRPPLEKKLSVKHGALAGRRYTRLAAVATGAPISSSGTTASGGGGGPARRIRGIDSVPQRVVSPSWTGGRDRGAGVVAGASSAPANPSERPFFPPMGVPTDPLLSAAISAADSWTELRDLYGANARRIDPAQLLEITQRLAHVTGAVVWPEGAPLPEPAPPGGAPWAPALTEQEAGEVVALAQTLCRATQVCLQEMYGMQQVAGLLQALVSLGVAPSPAWLRSAETVALRTQREGQEQGGSTASGELLNELMAISAAFQRLGHTPDRSFVALLGEVKPIEEVRASAASAASSASSSASSAAQRAAATAPQQDDDAPVLLVLAAPQLLCLARAVLLWGLQPPADWPEAFLQATYTRISRANKLAVAGRGGAGLGGDEEVEAAEAEAALGVGGLAALLWAAVMMEARPADPGGRWMAELSAAALRRLREVLAAPTVVVAAEAAAAAAAGSAAVVDSGGVRAPLPEAMGASLQDMASLLSALQQVMYDPGPAWINTCLQAAAAVQARTDPSASLTAAAAIGSPPPGDALAAVLFLAAQYDHPQDDETRGSVVGMAQAAQAWMGAQADVAAVAAAAAAAAAGGAGQAAAAAPPPPPLFTSRGLTQVLMALVRMGGQPSEEWVAAWAAAAEPLARGAGGGGGFDLDQVVAVLATAAEVEVVLPEGLQRALVEGLLTAPPPQAAAAGASSVGGVFPPPGGAAGAAAAGADGAGSATAPAAGVRSLPQFRQLLGVLELQLYALEPEWLEAFVGLVEDFRLRLGSRELLSVLRVLGGFKDTILEDTAGADTQPGPPTSPSPSAPSAGPRAAASTSARRPGAPIVLRPNPVVIAAAAAATSSSPASGSSASSPPPPAAAAPTVLDSGWVGGLLDDLKVRGGVRGPSELMQLAQALSTLSAPPSLLSYVEVFAVALTGEDGRRRKPSAATRAPAAAASPAPAGPAPAAAAKPSAARIRLRLQKDAAEKRAVAAAGAGGASTAAGAEGATEEAEAAAAAAAAGAAAAAETEEEEEAQQWALAWPAMLGAFAAAGHVPERRWWDRFAAATLPALESYEGPRLASTAVAALGLSSQAAEAAGLFTEEEEGEEGREGDEGREAALAAKLLPSLEWHQQALGHVAEAIRSCPVSMDEIRQQAVQVLTEQRRQGSGPTGEPPEGAEAATQEVAEAAEAEEAEAAALTFSAQEFAEVVQTLASELLLLLEPLAQPRLALPPQLLAVLEEVAEEAAEGAAAAVAAAASLAAGAGAGQAGSEGGGVEGKEGGEEELDLDAIAYAQQIITLVMQALIASDQAPSEMWMSRVAEVMTASRPGWGPGSETGELLQQQQLILSADQLTTTAYLAGRFEMSLQPEQVRLLLQHAARLVGSGELSGGELAATLAGLSGVRGVEVVEQGPYELEALLEALASQSSRLSAQGLGEAATALLQLGLGLHPDTAVRFRSALARSLTELAPPQMLAVLTAGGSLGLDPPSRELLAGLSLQVGRLAAHTDPLAPAAATEAAYEVLKWFPQVAPNDSEIYINRLREGLQPLSGRLEEVVPASASKLALLLASAGVVPEPPQAVPGGGGGGSGAVAERQRQQRAAALAPLVGATAEGLPDYDNEQLSNAVMGLSLLGVQLPSAWLEGFMEASRRQLADADGRSLSYILSGLADQRALPDGPYTAAFWGAVRRRASSPERDLDLLCARTLLEAAGQMGMRPDRETMQAVLDCALLPYRERPDPEGLTELVQVMAAFSFAPSPAWAAEVRTALAPTLSAMPPDDRDAVLAFLHAAMPLSR
ncbi:hypothetical protein PLESTB_000449100 [Pleodorina starrii]|uniref:Uncharacterized protein n=1 Tax=Pleodorina starrii TaxID=330485 RepID=A0A9W6BF82_9CHLO|nr:hypothetical protein PLESTM_000671700 [Pleodorina starrii]GLC50943.1 hypothetical protein PLESTB_000449100 [Pleodorina starrii]GLC69862.1 hypothetical protein PLESTF_000889000 [Pleodorina starrii]